MACPSGQCNINTHEVKGCVPEKRDAAQRSCRDEVSHDARDAKNLVQHSCHDVQRLSNYITKLEKDHRLWDKRDAFGEESGIISAVSHFVH